MCMLLDDVLCAQAAAYELLWILVKARKPAALSCKSNKAGLIVTMAQKNIRFLSPC